MRRVLKGLLIVSAVSIVLIGSGLLFLDRTLGSGMCETQIFERAVSPSGVAAQVQMTDCGATTGFSRVVLLTKLGTTSDSCTALALKGEPLVSLRWPASDVLDIRHNAPAEAVISSQSTCFGHTMNIAREI